MRIRLTPRAGADLDAIGRYVAAESPRAAVEQLAAIRAAIEALVDFADLGHPSYPKGRRVRTVPRLPYRVLYRVIGDEIVVLHIRHTSRRPLRRAP